MHSYEEDGIEAQVFIRTPDTGRYSDQRVNLTDREAVERHRASLLQYCRTAWRKNSTPTRVAQIGMILALLDAVEGLTFQRTGGPSYDMDQQRAYDYGITVGLLLRRQQLAGAGLDTAFVDAKIAREEANANLARRYTEVATKGLTASKRMSLRMDPLPMRISVPVKK